MNSSASSSLASVLVSLVRKNQNEPRAAVIGALVDLIVERFGISQREAAKVAVKAYEAAKADVMSKKRLMAASYAIQAGKCVDGFTEEELAAAKVMFEYVSKASDNFTGTHQYLATLWGAAYFKIVGYNG